jgi:hypothetical protein
MHPPQVRWLRRDGDAGVEQPQIVAVARSAHEPMLAQHHGLLVPVLGPMFDF